MQYLLALAPDWFTPKRVFDDLTLLQKVLHGCNFFFFLRNFYLFPFFINQIHLQIFLMQTMTLQISLCSLTKCLGSSALCALLQHCQCFANIKAVRQSHAMDFFSLSPWTCHSSQKNRYLYSCYSLYGCRSAHVECFLSADNWSEWMLTCMSNCSTEEL